MDNDNKKTFQEEWVMEYLKKSPEHRIALFTVIVTALGVLYSIAFTKDGLSDIFLIIPFIMLALGMQYKYFQNSVRRASKYLQETHPDDFIHLSGKYEEDAWKTLVFDVISKWLLFIGIPMATGISYSAIYLLNINKTPQPITSIVPPELHYLFIAYFALAMSVSLYLFVIRKQMPGWRQLWKLVWKKVDSWVAKHLG
jgi:hypothetical protein